MLINEILENSDCDSIIGDTISLLGHFANTTYDDILAKLSESGQPAQIVIPLPENYDILLPKFIRNLEVDAVARHVQVNKVHISYSSDSTSYEPIKSTDIVVMKNAIEALASINPSAPNYVVYVRFIYDIAELAFENSIRDVFSKVYDILILLNMKTTPYPGQYSLEGPKTVVDAAETFGAVYKFAIKELNDYNMLLAECCGLLDSGSKSLNRRIINSLVDRFNKSLKLQASGDISITDACVLAMANERIVICAITGDLDYNYNKVRIPYSRLMKQSQLLLFTKNKYLKYERESLDKAKQILDIGNLILEFDTITTLPTKLLPCSTAPNDKVTVTAEYIAEKLKYLTNPPIEARSIIFELSENKLAMLVAEFGAINFKVEPGNDKNSPRYIFKDPNDNREYGLFVSRNHPDKLTTTVYGISMDKSNMDQLIMLSGTPGYDYIYKPVRK